MATKTTEQAWASEKKCARCKKHFIAAPQHIFKKGVKWYCSWTCYNHRHDVKRDSHEERENDT